jgi:hypothetical protein
MKEHVVVFDLPPQYGKGVPEFYDLRVFDVPQDKRDSVVRLMKHLGFVEIEQHFMGGRLDRLKSGLDFERNSCIHAKYHAGTKLSEYHNFWEKKEAIELEIDRLQILH